MGKEIINKIKRQSTEWEKIFVNHVSGKGLMAKAHKALIQLNSKTKPKNKKRSNNKTQTQSV